MIQEVTICDECGKPKGETNHWIKIGISGLGSFVSFADGLSNTDSSQDICGQECATKAYQRWLSTGSLEKKQVAA